MLHTRGTPLSTDCSPVGLVEAPHGGSTVHTVSHASNTVVCGQHGEQPGDWALVPQQLSLHCTYITAGRDIFIRACHMFVMNHRQPNIHTYAVVNIQLLNCVLVVGDLERGLEIWARLTNTALVNISTATICNKATSFDFKIIFFYQGRTITNMPVLDHSLPHQMYTYLTLIMLLYVFGCDR